MRCDAGEELKTPTGIGACFGHVKAGTARSAVKITQNVFDRPSAGSSASLMWNSNWKRERE